MPRFRFKDIPRVTGFCIVALTIPYFGGMMGIDHHNSLEPRDPDTPQPLGEILSSPSTDKQTVPSALTDEEPSTVTARDPKEARRAPSEFTPQETLTLCPRLDVSNAPRHRGEERQVVNYSPIIRVNGISLYVVPTEFSCFSSGFGQRDGRLHSGVDYQGRPPGNVYAAGAGTIREAGYRRDFGFYVLIDHGAGVFTRYAHLENIQRGLQSGKTISMGTTIGKMGNSAGYPIPVHLHYELLLGDYNTPAKSFGLTNKDIFDYL